jgi:predicted GNAT family N-acyltransferase
MDHSLNLVPELLTNKSKIQEIYDLRVSAYENSPKSIYVNKELFPNGWRDHLDELEDTYHFIVQDKNKIVASGRVAIIDDIEKITDLDEAFEKYTIPEGRPFAYFSRLVVHKDYRKLGIPDSLDNVRINFLKQNSLAKFAIGWATPDRHPSLFKYGFVDLGLFNYKFANTENNIAVSFFCNYL